MRILRGGLALAVMAALLSTVLPATAAQAEHPNDAPSAIIANPQPAIGAIGHLRDLSDHFCTGSIINSPKMNIVLTAAHCVGGSDPLYFAPQFHAGAAPPWGVWKVSSVVVDPRFKT